MAEVATAGDAAGRGTTVIADRVFERTAWAAAVAAPGVVRHGGAVGRITGRELPRVEVRRDRDHVRVRLDVALTWPSPLAATTAGVRDARGADPTRVTGSAVDAVDVTVTHLETDDGRPS